MTIKPVVIFGTGPLSSVAWYCLTHDSSWQVKAFTVDRAYLQSQSQTHEGLPVVPFEDLPSLYPPTEARLSIPLGYTDINELRRDRYLHAKALGYNFANYISSRASVWPDLQIGENCLIFEHAVIQPFARLGDNVIIRSSACIGHHCIIGNHTFVAAGACFGGNTTTSEQVFIGVGAVLRDGLNLAERSFIGAGAVVVSNTEADGVYVGNPARKIVLTSMQVTTNKHDG